MQPVVVPGQVDEDDARRETPPAVRADEAILVPARDDRLEPQPVAATPEEVAERERVVVEVGGRRLEVTLPAGLGLLCGIAAGAVGIAKVLFFIFLVLFVVSLIAGTLRRGP